MLFFKEADVNLFYVIIVISGLVVFVVGIANVVKWIGENREDVRKGFAQGLGFAVAFLLVMAFICWLLSLYTMEQFNQFAF